MMMFCVVLSICFVFFFKQKTAYEMRISDWSSDVCSSDLERVHLSPSACRRRVQRLERDGVIAGYRAEVDPEHVGLGLQAFVRVQLNHHDAESVAAFADFVNEWDEVVACHALTGDMDYLLQIAVSDLEHFSRFLLDRLLAQAGVADRKSTFVLRTVKAFRGMPDRKSVV